MSNIIPPLLSNSPPPPPSPEEDEDDEFGDFTVANDLSYGCDGFSPLPSPDLSPEERSPFKIPKTIDGVAQNKQEIRQEDKEKQITTCDCSIENKTSSTDNIFKKHGSDKISENGVEVSVVERSFFPNGDIEHSFSKLTIEEKVHFKVNNKEDTLKKLDFGFVEDLESSQLSEKPHTDSCRDLNYIEDKSSDCLEQRLSEDTETIENHHTSNENTIKPEFFQQNDLFQENILANVTADLEVETIFSKSDSNSVLDTHCEIDDSPQNIVTVTEVCDKSNYLKNEIDFDIIYEEKQEKCSESNVTETAEDEFGDFSNYSIEVDEKQTQNFESSIQNHGVLESNEECPTSSELEVKNVPPSADDSSLHKQLQNNPPAVSADTDFNSEIDEFADFTSHQAFAGTSHEISKPVDNDEDDFDDFGEFASTVCHDQTPAAISSEQEEFQSFADFSQTPESICLLLDGKEAFSKAEIIVKDMFPALDEVIEDFNYFDLVENDFIFKQLQDVTDTPALTYQWSKSAGQKALLKSLNIDVRNILYGPSWNPSVPRFAANLGLQPLEPIKSEKPTSAPLKPTPSIAQSQNVDIPSAQFDWTGSGLVNPLDSLPKDTTSAPSDQIKPPEKPKKKSPVTVFDPTTENVLDDKQEKNDDFDDFTSYRGPEAVQMSEWTNVLPLRETYISNTTSEASGGGNIEAWLQPTIVTPELPRKTLTGDEEIPSQATQTDEKEGDDEFTEFQMSSTDNFGVDKTVLGDSKTVLGDSGSGKTSYDDEFSDFQMSSIGNIGVSKTVSDPSKTVSDHSKTVLDHSKSVSDHSKTVSDHSKTVLDHSKTVFGDSIDDDEFSDFHMSSIDNIGVSKTVLDHSKTVLDHNKTVSDHSKTVFRDSIGRNILYDDGFTDFQMSITGNIGVDETVFGDDKTVFTHSIMRKPSYADAFSDFQANSTKNIVAKNMVSVDSSSKQLSCDDEFSDFQMSGTQNIGVDNTVLGDSSNKNALCDDDFTEFQMSVSGVDKTVYAMVSGDLGTKKPPYNDDFSDFQMNSIGIVGVGNENALNEFSSRKPSHHVQLTDFQRSTTGQIGVTTKEFLNNVSNQKKSTDFVSEFDVGVKIDEIPPGSASSSSSIPASSTDISISNLSSVVAVNGPSRLAKVQSEEDDDEFTDFHFSKPQATAAVSAPVLEPLKPVPVYSKNTPTPINWPDPGVTDDDIRKIEEVFSRPTPASAEEPQAARQTFDEEEWTDFVSVQKSSPVHKVKASERERTSSPDLPLSVFNLGSIQPAKQPIPVITPHGLVQTRLSAGPATASPKTQARNGANFRPQIPLARPPSIISEQYVSQAYGFGYGAPPKTNSATSNSWSFASQTAPDDDEWGEFVSSPLPPAHHHQNGHVTSGANVITNPRHYVDSSGGRASKKSAVSSLVLPELDFVAPKGRTAASRKK